MQDEGDAEGVGPDKSCDIALDGGRCLELEAPACVSAPCFVLWARLLTVLAHIPTL